MVKAKAPSKRKTTPPCPAYPAWTTAKFWSFIRSGLRAKWTRWPAKYEVLADAKRTYKGKNTKQKYEYMCAKCGSYFPAKEVEVDHIVPCGTLKAYTDLAGFVERLFVSKEKLRVVCKPCHAKITAEERNKT